MSLKFADNNNSLFHPRRIDEMGTKISFFGSVSFWQLFLGYLFVLAVSNCLVKFSFSIIKPAAQKLQKTELKKTKQFKSGSTKAVGSNSDISQVFDFDEGENVDLDYRGYIQESWRVRPAACTPLEGKYSSKALFSLQKFGTWYPEHSFSTEEKQSPIADELLQLFSRLSSPEVCDSKRMMLPVLPSYGLGATLNFIIQPATISIAHNVTLLTPPLGKWSFEGTKNALASDANHSIKEYTFARFLVPFSTCDERAILGRVSQQQHSTVQDGSNSETCGEKGENATLCRCSGYNQIKYLRDPMVSVDDEWLRNRYMNKATGECSVPMYMSAVHVPLVQKERQLMDKHSIFHARDSFKHLPQRFQKKGPLWFTSYVYAALLRPHPIHLTPLLDQVWRKGGLEDPMNKPVLSIHIRLGDACTSSQKQSKVRTCEGFQHYLRIANKMRKRYGFKSLYVATDDARTARQAHRLSGKDGWNKVVTGFDRNTAGYSDDALRRGDLNLLKMAEMTFIDIFLMARGDGFLGKFSSNLDRIAVGLMLGTRNCIPPIVSLDSAWCNPWVGKMKTKKGVFTCALA